MLYFRVLKLKNKGGDTMKEAYSIYYIGEDGSKFYDLYSTIEEAIEVLDRLFTNDTAQITLDGKIVFKNNVARARKIYF